MAQCVSSLIHPSWQPPLLSALWNLHHAPLIFVYKSQIASTHFVRNRSAERAAPKAVTAHAFFTRAVNTSTVKHQHTVILMSGLRGDSLTSVSLTHRLLLSLTRRLTDFVHAWHEWCSMENWSNSTEIYSLVTLAEYLETAPSKKGKHSDWKADRKEEDRFRREFFNGACIT